MIQIAIHRPQQIGGQITEITTSKGTRIIIDLGVNLSGKDPLNNRKAIEKLTKGCKAILYTHYHGDHVGLCHHVPSDVPQYIGSVAKDVMRYKYERLKNVPEMKKESEKNLDALGRMITYKANIPIDIDDIKVTPYFVSHSACDAHMFLIEAEGKRILHTGDFRGHSKVGSRLIDMLKTYVGKVDVLIIEGTMLSRKDEHVDTEDDLEKKAEKWMKDYKFVFIHCSSTDLERLYGFTKAHRKGHPQALLVCDGYQYDVLQKVFSNIEYKGRKPYNFGKLEIYEGDILHLKELREKMIKEGFTMFIRTSNKFLTFLDKIQPKLDHSQTLFIYSMWSGYVTRPDTMKEEVVKMQERFKTDKFLSPILNLHTSGHATMETLREVCETLKPSTAIIPIHRDKNSDFRNTNIESKLQEKIVTKDCTIDGIEITFQ